MSYLRRAESQIRRGGVSDTVAQALMPALLLRILLASLLCAGPGLAAPQDSFRNSPRVHESIRAGNLYLSLQDALALAIENNLDIELERSALPAADAELLRAKGGGTQRGLSFTLAEAPAGVGGTLSPVVTSAAIAGRSTPPSKAACGPPVNPPIASRAIAASL